MPLLAALMCAIAQNVTRNIIMYCVSMLSLHIESTDSMSTSGVTNQLASKVYSHDYLRFSFNLSLNSVSMLPNINFK